MTPMEVPRPVLTLIAAAGLIGIAGMSYVGYVVSNMPPVPPGVVSASPAAQQPAKDEQGEPLPVQPGEPEENQPVVNAPPAG
jgi:hypothetical protein